MFRIARPQRRVLVRTTVGLFAAASLVLTGCGAGQHAQSVNEQAAMLGANGKVGDLSALNVRLQRPPGPEVPGGIRSRGTSYALLECGTSIIGSRGDGVAAAQRGSSLQSHPAPAVTETRLIPAGNASEPHVVGIRRAVVVYHG